MLPSSVDEYIAATLSPDQQAICEQDGCFVVKACPGSGKTKTVGAWLAKRAAGWTTPHAGIAALSFTNIAWQEIAAEVQAIGLPPVSWPHFLGTIDSFVNHYLLYPFGASVMGCSRPPQVVFPSDMDFVGKFINMPNECNKKGCKPWWIRLDAEAHPDWESGPTSRHHLKCLSESCRKHKCKVWRIGYATPSDAMYVAMRLLSETPDLATILARRFPKIVVDEAQDTSDVQMAVLDTLVSAGCELVLVGDPDQAVYGWNHADPAFLEEKASEWTCLSLTDNYRCSPTICELTQPLSTLPCPSPSTGPAKDCAHSALLLRYDSATPDGIAPIFASILDARQIELDRSAILVRDHKMRRRVSGEPDVAWPHSTKNNKGKPASWLQKLLISAVAAREAGDCRQAHKAVIKALLFLCSDAPGHDARQLLVESIGFRDWRIGTWQLMLQLPEVSISLADWGPVAREIVKAFLAGANWPPAQNPGSYLRKCTLPGSDLPAGDFCSVVPEALEASVPVHVIHQVKAQTFEGVLVVAGPGRNGVTDLRQWFGETTEEEEKRVGYVAMTRASHLLVLAVPDDEFDSFAEEHAHCFTTHESTGSA